MRSLGEIVNRVADDVARANGVALGLGALGLGLQGTSPGTAAAGEAAFLAEAERWLRQAVGEAGRHDPVDGDPLGNAAAGARAALAA